MSNLSNESTVRRWVEQAWNRGDFSQSESMYDRGYVMHDPTGPVHGVAGLVAFISAYRSGFSNLHMSVDATITRGDEVAWRFTVTGRHDGAFFEMPPTFRDVSVGGIVMSRFADGRWAEDWVQYDAAGMLRQLGVGEAVAAG